MKKLTTVIIMSSALSACGYYSDDEDRDKIASEQLIESTNKLGVRIDTHSGPEMDGLTREELEAVGVTQ